MAKWKFEGVNEYAAKLEALSDNTEEILGKAIFYGAKIVADEIKAAIWTIPVDDAFYDNGSTIKKTEEHQKHATQELTYTGVKKGNMRSGIRTNERIDLAKSFGIAKMKNDDGYINVKTGFDEYNRYGVPNIAIARSVESGTSFMPKFGTIGKAARSAKKKCEQKMESVLEDELKKMMK